MLGTRLFLRLFGRFLLCSHLRLARLLLFGARCLHLGRFGIKLPRLTLFGLRLLLTHLLLARGFSLLQLFFLRRLLFGGLGGFPQLAHLHLTIIFTLLLLRLAQCFLLLLLLHLRFSKFLCPLTHLLVIRTVFLQFRRFFRFRNRLLFQALGCFPTFFIHDRLALCLHLFFLHGGFFLLLNNRRNVSPVSSIGFRFRQSPASRLHSAGNRFVLRSNDSRIHCHRRLRTDLAIHCGGSDNRRFVIRARLRQRRTVFCLIGHGFNWSNRSQILGRSRHIGLGFRIFVIAFRFILG